MASLQRTISRAIAIKGLNKKQKRLKQKRLTLNEIKEMKQRERERGRKNADNVRVDR
jgi:hypothetical protein